MPGFPIKPFYRKHAGSSEPVLFVSLVLVVICAFGAWSLFSPPCAGAKVPAIDMDIHAFTSALKMYKINCATYPTTLQGLTALVEKPADLQVSAPLRWMRLMDRTKQDPWGNEYVYQFPGTKNSEEFDLISKGPDGALGTSDDIRNN